MKLIKDIVLQTNGYFAIEEKSKTTVGKATTVTTPKKEIKVMNNKNKDIQECNLVICNSGNLILKGYNGQTWEYLWTLNDRELGEDCA